MNIYVEDYVAMHQTKQFFCGYTQK